MAGVAVAAVAAAEGRADNNNARCRWRHCARRWHHPFTLAAATWLATGARRALTCSASGSLHGVHQTRGPGGAARKPEACACTCECRRVCHVCVVYYRYDCDEAGNRCSCSNRRGSSCCTVTTGVTAAAAPVCRCCCCTNLYCSRSRCLNSESSRHSHSKRQKQQYEKRTTHQCGARHRQLATADPDAAVAVAAATPTTTAASNSSTPAQSQQCQWHPTATAEPEPRFEHASTVITNYQRHAGHCHSPHLPRCLYSPPPRLSPYSTRTGCCSCGRVAVARA